MHVFDIAQPVFRFTEASCHALYVYILLFWPHVEEGERTLHPPHLQRSALTPNVRSSSMNLANTHKREHTGCGKAERNWR